MVKEFTKGKNQKYVANISFGLNWDDKDMKSVKVKEGQELFYDGDIVVVDNGYDEIKGRCTGLRTAISVMGWLTPIKNGASQKALKEHKIVSENLFKNEDYDFRLGGNLETHIRINNGVGRREVVKEEDLIVKEIPSLKSKSIPTKSGKLEIAGDQVEVPKDRLVVSSSTIRTRTDKRKTTVIQSDEMGADSVLPLKKIKSPTKSGEKKAYIVDNTTPRQIRDDMTRDEVKRITKVINADESQDAKVVKTLDIPSENVQEAEGIILRKTTSPKEVSFNKVTPPSGMTIKTTVGAGSNSSFGSQGGVVVGVSETAKSLSPELAKDLLEAPPPTEEEKREAARELAEREEKVKARAAARKKASSETLKLMEKEKEVETDEAPEKAKKPTKTKKPKKVKKSKVYEKLDITPELVQEIKLGEDITKITTPEATTDYLLILPDNWNKMHWVKKEKFIKDINDAFFVQFILSMESVKAVKNACMERLEELGQKESV